MSRSAPVLTTCGARTHACSVPTLQKPLAKPLDRKRWLGRGFCSWVCGAGTLACSAETHLGACQSVAHSGRDALLFHAAGFPHRRRISTLFEPVRQCSGRKPVDAERSLGAAGKSACATKIGPRQGPSFAHWDAWPRRSQECERCTHECVRHDYHEDITWMV